MNKLRLASLVLTASILLTSNSVVFASVEHPELLPETDVGSVQPNISRVTHVEPTEERIRAFLESRAQTESAADSRPPARYTEAEDIDVSEYEDLFDENRPRAVISNEPIHEGSALRYAREHVTESDIKIEPRRLQRRYRGQMFVLIRTVRFQRRKLLRKICRISIPPMCFRVFWTERPMSF